jgi:hypothetical protein
LRRPFLVKGLLITRDAVRTTVLIICGVAVLLGLPRLAVFFREPQYFGNLDLISDAPGNRIVAVNHADAPHFSAAKGPVVQTSSTTNAHPANEENLILAIQEELGRLGYYDGPITKGWTEGVRGAVRKFSGSGRTKPSQELLMALRSTKPEIKAAVSRQGATINLQAAQDVINGRVPTIPVTTSEDGLPSEGYLPPWDALRERYTQIAQSLPPGYNSALTVRISARSSRIDTRTRGRRSYASTRRRSRVVYSYGGFFGF